jgi:hypothetical protein
MVDIVELLIEAGVLTREQLTHAQRVQSKLDTPRPILELLKGSGYLRRPGQGGRPQPGPMSLGNLLVELGHLTMPTSRSP